mmetsp:Transcript_11096/g.31942  ORF Transcript_11096/g.31942 Transcript_11096/m.31942 type:complete len:252 (-) Transcript_11096:487-1242(-)
MGLNHWYRMEGTNDCRLFFQITSSTCTYTFSHDHGKRSGCGGKEIQTLLLEPRRSGSGARVLLFIAVLGIDEQLALEVVDIVLHGSDDVVVAKFHDLLFGGLLFLALRSLCCCCHSDLGQVAACGKVSDQRRLGFLRTKHVREEPTNEIIFVDVDAERAHHAECHVGAVVRHHVEGVIGGLDLVVCFHEHPEVEVAQRVQRIRRHIILALLALDFLDGRIVQMEPNRFTLGGQVGRIRIRWLRKDGEMAVA